MLTSEYGLRTTKCYRTRPAYVTRRSYRNPADATLLVAIGIPPKLLSLNFFSKLSNEGHGCGIVLALAKISWGAPTHAFYPVISSDCIVYNLISVLLILKLTGIFSKPQNPVALDASQFGQCWFKDGVQLRAAVGTVVSIAKAQVSSISLIIGHWLIDLIDFLMNLIDIV